MKLLIYSHDTFGLGHLRRARTIANHLSKQIPNIEILIVSGSRFGRAFSYPERVSVVEIPAVEKQSDGSYQAVAENMTISDVIEARAAAIMRAYQAFKPDMVLVDKEPLGLYREMLNVLRAHREAGGITILGLRDVLDSPNFVKTEWDRKQILRYLDDLFDEIWIYGPDGFYDPLFGVELSPEMKQRIQYTGFLERESVPVAFDRGLDGSDYILITSGGGGDGFELMKSAAAVATQTDFGKAHRFVMALGAFMPEDKKAIINETTRNAENVEIIDFRADHEALLKNAQLVVGMCGYNTFCEVVSFNKRAIFVPRVTPRSEQAIRAARAAEMNWSSIVYIDDAENADDFARMMDRAMAHILPQDATIKPDMSGLSRITDRVRALAAKSDPKIISLR